MIRIERMQFRVDTQERKEIELLAKKEGYKQLSDYLRDRALKRNPIDKEELRYMGKRLIVLSEKI